MTDDVGWGGKHVADESLWAKTVLSNSRFHGRDRAMPMLTPVICVSRDAET
jgi:hypothetical protein